MTNLFTWDYEQKFNSKYDIKWSDSNTQVNVYIPLAFIYMCNKQSWEQGIHGWYNGSNIYIEACLTYDGIQNDKQRS